MDRRSKTHPSQWNTVLDFAEKNPMIITRRLDGPAGKKKYDVLWKEISVTLNSLGYISKSVDKWQKAVADWKSKVKAKAADIKRGIKQTGGGSPSPPLNENELRLMNILGWSAAAGDENRELGFVNDRNKTIGKSTVIYDHSYANSPPPLRYLETQVSSINENLTTQLDNTSISIQSCSKDIELSENEVAEKYLEDKENRGKKRRNKESLNNRKKFIFKTSNVPTSKLENMHEETVQLLNEINNVKRVAT